mmetsp:Transcript_28265/g.43350  ORF Transcript_28265/g.43350 Transcript_28265/m.43350 type:complete len:437 (+) Transcript_28265:206-1516(+)
MADKKASSFSDGEATASDTTRKRKAESQDLPLTDDASSTKPKQPKRQGQLLGSVISEEPSVYLQQKMSAEPAIEPSKRTLQIPRSQATNIIQQQNAMDSFTTPQATETGAELSPLNAIHNMIAQQQALSGTMHPLPVAALNIPNMMPAATLQPQRDLSGLPAIANALNQQNAASILMPATSLLSNMPFTQMMPVAQYPALSPSPSALPLSVGRSDLLQALLLNNSVSATTDQNKIIDALTQPGTSVIPHATLPRTDNASATSQEHRTPVGGTKTKTAPLSDSKGITKSSKDCLYMPGDDDNLSEHQVKVRKQIEICKVTEYDLQLNTQGRRVSLTLGQAGVRCRHCASKPLRMRGRGSAYYPKSLLGLYQACQNMANTHLLTTCTSIDPKIREELKVLSNKREKTGAGKQYWAYTGEALGLYEVDNRLFRRAQEES